MLLKIMADIIQNVLSSVLEAVYKPFWAALFVSIIMSFVYMYAYKPLAAGKGIKNVTKAWWQNVKTSAFFRKLWFLTFVFAMILFSTVLMRSRWKDPLSSVMNGFQLVSVAEDGTVTVQSDIFRNIIMMVPFIFMLFWTFPDRVLKNRKLWNVLLRGTVIAFVFSVAIELSQLFFQLGTFQLSDILYNTVSGFIGALLYWVLYKIKHAAKKKKPAPQKDEMQEKIFKE